MEENIRNQLEKIFKGLSDKIGELSNLLTMSPGDAFGNSFWDSLLSLGSLVVVPFAMTILGLFIAMEFYTVYVKSNGELDLQLVATTVMKFVLPFVLITKTYELIEWVFRLFNSLVIKMGTGLITSGTIGDQSEKIEAIMKEVSEMGWWDQFLYRIDLMPYSWGIELMGIIIFVVVYGRLFEIIIYWFFSPVFASTLIHSEHNQIGVNFVKMFSALIFQGAIMFLCVAIYVVLISNNAINVNGDGMMQMFGYTALLIFCLVKTGNMSKRMFGTF